MHRYDSPERPFLLSWKTGRRNQGGVKNENTESSFFPNSYGGNDPHEGTHKPAAGILLSPAGSARKNPAITPLPITNRGGVNHQNPQNT